jgi:hypothetical protein
MVGSAVLIVPAMALKVLPVIVQLAQPWPSIAAVVELEKAQLAMVPRSAPDWMAIAWAEKLRRTMLAIDI